MTVAVKHAGAPRNLQPKSERGRTASTSLGLVASDAAPGQDSGQSKEEILRSAKEGLRVYRALVARAVDVFGDEIMAAHWLSTPNPDFNGEQPLEAARRAGMSDETLEQILEPVFVRIEEGIYW